MGACEIVGVHRMFGLSSAERQFLIDGVELNVRNDGRSRLDFRHFTIETGIIATANGSARLKLDNTDVMVGVRVDLAEPKLDRPNEGTITFAVECSPSASPEFQSRGAEDLAISITQVLARSYKNALDWTSLCVIPGKLVWAIYVDALVLDFEGNPYDAISIATRAALHNTMIPRITLEDGEVEVTDDPQDCTRLDVSNVPVTVTLTKIGTRFLVDATLEEEQCMGVRVIVGISPKGHVCSMQMTGHGAVEPTSLYEMIQTSQKLGRELIEGLDKALAQEAKSALPKTSTSAYFN